MPLTITPAAVQSHQQTSQPAVNAEVITPTSTTTTTIKVPPAVIDQPAILTSPKITNIQETDLSLHINQIATIVTKNEEDVVHDLDSEPVVKQHQQANVLPQLHHRTPSPQSPSFLILNRYQQASPQENVPIKTTLLRSSLPNALYDPITTTLRTSSITTTNSLTRLSYQDDDANEILLPSSHVTTSDQPSPSTHPIPTSKNASCSPPATQLTPSKENNIIVDTKFPLFNFQFQQNHHRHSTSFLPTKTNSFMVNTTGTGSTCGSGVNITTTADRLGSLLAGRFSNLFQSHHHHHYHHHMHHQKHLHQQPATQHRSTIDFNEFITKNNFYNKQNDMTKPKSHQDFLSLSLSPPLNRRNKDLPALRGPFVSL